MEATENLTEEQIQEQKAANDAAEEAFEAQLVKRFGAGSSELVKKSEPAPVETAEEKKAREDKKSQAVLTTGLEQNWTTKGEYDGYLEAIKADKIEVTRKKFIRDNPELGDKAAATFNTFFRIDEDDDIEGDDEVFAPNEIKKAARQLAEKLADEEINTTYGSVIKLNKRYDDHIAAETQRKTNQELINKSILEIPAEMPIEIDDDKYIITLSPAEIAESHKIFGNDELQKKGLTAEEIKGNAAVYLKTTHLARIIKEIRDVAVDTALDQQRRGVHGVVPVRKMDNSHDDDKLKFVKSKGII